MVYFSSEASNDYIKPFCCADYMGFTIMKPKFEKVDFTLQTMGIDQNTLQSVMIMELTAADRERCLRPKLANSTNKTD